eukprot:6203693-Pleurochrysis_carterae.AAC.4
MACSSECAVYPSPHETVQYVMCLSVKRYFAGQNNRIYVCNVVSSLNPSPSSIIRYVFVTSSPASAAPHYSQCCAGSKLSNKSLRVGSETAE